MSTVRYLGCSFLIFASMTTEAGRLDDCNIIEPLASELVAEHVYGGPLNNTPMDARSAYVLAFDEIHHVPSWTAWHAKVSYRDTPTRKGIWYNFNEDPEHPEVKLEHYKGWYNSEHNYARGHLAPFYISGGDRDGDGRDAEIESTLQVEDPFDACTVFEINSLANVAPQYHNKFNGVSGLWYKLESLNRGMIDRGRELYVFAGTVFQDGLVVEKIGDRNQAESEWLVGVPHGFFKVVIDPARQDAIAFLFNHQSDISGGCPMDSELSDCIVDFETLEKVTGLSFFTGLSSSQRKTLKTSSTTENWAFWQ
jgi:endonuclease G